MSHALLTASQRLRNSAGPLTDSNPSLRYCGMDISPFFVRNRSRKRKFKNWTEYVLVEVGSGVIVVHTVDQVPLRVRKAARRQRFGRQSPKTAPIFIHRRCAADVGTATCRWVRKLARPSRHPPDRNPAMQRAPAGFRIRLSTCEQLHNRVDRIELSSVRRISKWHRKQH
jgi:hypothetical protein